MYLKACLLTIAMSLVASGAALAMHSVVTNQQLVHNFSL